MTSIPASGQPARFATWCGFAAMCLGMFMAILDIQVVATSLPAIQAALAIAPDQMSWIQTAYLIAEVIAPGFFRETLVNTLILGTATATVVVPFTALCPNFSCG